jgi:ornithine carbamoyltransferase
MPKRDFISLFDVEPNELEEIFRLATALKKRLASGDRTPLLSGRVIALLFEKPSLRTRVSFEVAMAHLGGSSLFLGRDVGWGERESTADFGQVLGCYVDAVVCRTRSHDRITELAAFCDCPVINGLSDKSHPCQAVADLFTMQEVFGRLQGLKLAFIGDANNVARSLAIACAGLGVDFVLAAPSNYQFDSHFLMELAKKAPRAKCSTTDDPVQAVRDADVVYTDVWTSMGQESEEQLRTAAFADYQVNAALMKRAPRGARFMHCLPAKRGVEVTDEIIDGSQSIVVQQAANRLHAQKGLLACLLNATATS